MNLDRIIPTASVALADRVRELERGGSKVIKLQTGDPDFATHPEVSEAAYKAIRDGYTHYSDSKGLPDLRKALADELSRESFTKLSENNILITTGAAGAIAAVMAALVEQGDEVIVLQPAWPTVASLAVLMGASVVTVNSLQNDEALLNDIKNRISSRTKLVCINTPNNPCGTVLSQQFLADLNELIISKEHIYLLSDEVYRVIYFGKKSTCAGFLGMNSRLIFVDSFSKRFAMTGWRIGFVAAETSVISKLVKASQLMITHVAPFVQKAALYALSSAEVLRYTESMVATYKQRANDCIELLQLNKIEHLRPEGAFYIFLKVKDDDLVFAESLLNDFKLCVVPGSAYGQPGRGYVRITYAAQQDLVAQGIGLIARALKS